MRRAGPPSLQALQRCETRDTRAAVPTLEPTSPIHQPGLSLSLLRTRRTCRMAAPRSPAAAPPPAVDAAPASCLAAQRSGELLTSHTVPRR
jgi:hypothetical protein